MYFVIQKGACETELKTFCSDNSHEDNRKMGLECLKSIEHSELGYPCRKALLIEEKEEAVMNSVDYALLKICKHEIKNYNCRFQAKSKVNGIFRCLKVHKFKIIF